VTGRQVATGWP